MYGGGGRPKSRCAEVCRVRRNPTRPSGYMSSRPIVNGLKVEMRQSLTNATSSFLSSKGGAVAARLPRELQVVCEESPVTVRANSVSKLRLVAAATASTG